MAEFSSQERSEKPTPRRRQKARERGEVAQSREWNSTLVLFGGLLVLLLFKNPILQGIQELFQSVAYAIPHLIWNEEELGSALHLFFKKGGKVLLPLFLFVVVAAIAGNWSQTGIIFTSEPLKPSVSKLNPISGLKKIFSERLFSETLKTLFKLSGLGLIAYFNIKKIFDEVDLFLGLEAGSLIMAVSQRLLVLCIQAALFMCALSLFDFFIQRKQMTKRLMMTRKELKDELKEVEGNPQVKSKIRSLMKKLSGKRMMQQVEDAQVVVTNPTHFAVALQYKKDMKAPRVLAKGADRLAKKIIEKAKSCGIPIVENKPLARLLYRVVDIDEAIPVSMYKAVAEVMAYVYRLRHQAWSSAGGGVR